MDDKRLDEKLTDLQKIMEDSQKSLEEMKFLQAGKLDTALEEIEKMSAKIEAIYDPERGIFPRLKELESWKTRQDEKEKTHNKIIVSAIISVIAAALTTFWNIMVRK